MPSMRTLLISSLNNMQLFFSNIKEDNIFTFDENESKHIIKVLRHKKGDLINVTAGRGKIYSASIISDDPRRCRASVTGTPVPVERHDYYLHIAIAPTKNHDRLEWFVEKSVEMGIDEITPVICEHSERKKVRIDRLQKVMLSAMKQSYKAHITKINTAVAYSDLINNEFGGNKYIAHLDSGKKTESPGTAFEKNKNILILIGPEGDFSREEIIQALENDFTPISLGNSRLRTETAGVAACCGVYFANQ